MIHQLCTKKDANLYIRLTKLILDAQNFEFELDLFRKKHYICFSFTARQFFPSKSLCKGLQINLFDF